ncbi:MAG: LamG domain-containing protein [Bacteroidia bacterium]
MRIFSTLLATFALVIFCFSFGFGQNHSLSFDGTDDYVQTTYPGISGGAARTVECWINTTYDHRPPGQGGNGQGVLVDWGSFITGGRFTFNVLQNNSIRIEVGGNGLAGTTAINDGNWHHVAVVFDPTATNQMSLYIDGTLNTSGTLTVVTNTSSVTDLRIGRRIDGVNGFNGLIDEVKVWNVARSATQIANNRNTELTGTESGLVAYFKFDENQASCDLIDCAANNHGDRLGAAGANNTPQFSTSVPSITDVACGTTLQNCTLPCRTFITGISTSNLSPCDSAGTTSNANDDTFTADVTVAFSGIIPATGFLTISGDGSASVPVGSLSGSSHTVTGVTMRANGMPINLSASFSDEPCANFRNSNAGQAPAACSAGASGGPGMTGIPTMSEWGLIIFGLIMFGLSLVFGVQHKMAMAGNAAVSGRYRLPFDMKRFMRILPLVYLAIAAIFAIALFFGYELTNADIPGSLIAGAIVVYLIQFIGGLKN